MESIKYPKLKSVSVLENYRLKLNYSNGEKRIYDFKPNLSHSFYKELNDPSLFRSIKVIEGEIIWDTGQDFCPHTLYEKSVTEII